MSKARREQDMGIAAPMSFDESRGLRESVNPQPRGLRESVNAQPRGLRESVNAQPRGSRELNL